MGLVLLDGVAFRVDPTSITWDYRVKTTEQKTVGGKVVQVYGTDIGDMTVQGTFGRGGWQEQQVFLKRMKALADKQVNDAGQMNSNANPSRFLWPGRGWDFGVYLKAFSQPGAPIDANVVHDPAVFAPEWMLTLFMVHDNVGLAEIAKDDYIQRLSEGLGWQQSKYNGPIDNADLEADLKGQSVQDYILTNFGISPSTPTTPQGAGA